MTRQIVRSFRPELRVGTTAQWAASTLILREGEPGVEYNSEKDVVGIKIGDGIRLWSALEYAATGGGGGGSLPAEPTEEELADPDEPAIRSWSPARLWELVQAWYLSQAPVVNPFDPPNAQRTLNEYLTKLESLPNGVTAGTTPGTFAAGDDLRLGSTLLSLGVASNSAQIKGASSNWAVATD
jgi:hypothetical protein